MIVRTLNLDMVGKLILGGGMGTAIHFKLLVLMQPKRVRSVNPVGMDSVIVISISSV